jgi:hypothetical protein
MRQQAARTQLNSTPLASPLRRMLQRSCACGNHTVTGAECTECRKSKTGLSRNDSPLLSRGSLMQTKLDVGTTDDPLEREADRVADQLSATPSNAAPVPIRLSTGSSSAAAGTAPESVDRALAGTGEPLNRPLRQDMEQRFGHDFSRVRVHTDATAARSARDVNAHAYTVGREIVFGAGRFAPGTSRGRNLIGHELTHVLQQSNLAPRIQRQSVGDLRLSEANDAVEAKIRATPAFLALDAPTTALAEEIIVEIRKRPILDQYHFFSKLQLLFDTAVKAPVTIAKETQASTVTAAKTETTRLAKPAEKANTGLEETASANRKRNWLAVKGKWGGGTYYVDKTSALNIVVKADILLTPKGSDPARLAEAVKAKDAIKKMEDGIEKAASTKGYTVDIRFVETARSDTFKADVDPSRWEDAENWSGGSPVGFAHELHHMFAFDLDRYNYIEAHADNTSMEIPNRLYWFRKELSKPANYNDPTSIMNSSSHPNDDDACQVAQLDVATCVPARAAARAAGKL